jgi:hypothetical protein
VALANIFTGTGQLTVRSLVVMVMLFVVVFIVTDIVPSLSISIGMGVVVMELCASHPTKARFSHASRTARAHASRRRHP